MNAVSVASGSEQVQNYFSYANTAERGITGSNRLMRHNFNLRTTTGLFRQRLKLDGNINFMRQVVEDKPVPGGFYMNPLVGLYRFPRGVDITPYREHFEVYDAGRKLNVQDWIAPSDDFEQNPYWIVNRIRSRSLRNRVMASFTADWKVNGWLRLKARGNVDYVNDKVRQKFYASTAPALAGANGRYIESSYSETLFNGEVLAMFDKRLSPDWEFSATAGAGLNDRTVNSLRIDSKTGVALFPQCVQRRQYRHERFGLCRRTDRCAAPDAVAFRHGVVQVCREPQFRGYGTQRLGIDARLHLPRRQRVLLLFGRRIVGDRQDVRAAPVDFVRQGSPDMEPRGERHPHVHHQPQIARYGRRGHQCRRRRPWHRPQT